MAAANGAGFSLWGNTDNYKIYMAEVADATYGGRLDTTSDYNMYFKMSGGTNRGWVFKSGTTNVAQIDTSGTFYGTATQAKYADLAERYETDGAFEPGTVMVFGGDKEITACATDCDVSVAGAISTAPAYMMNSEAGDDTTHPFVALRGRVPVKVIGSVKKGDLLVTSNVPGHARSNGKQYIGGAVFAKAIADFDGEQGVVEAVIL
jgi:hypothetical protein